MNNLTQRIKVVKRKPDESLIPLDELAVDTIDFTMTNPPFYESEDSMLTSLREKSRPPLTACTGAPVEMVTNGGELGFLGRILEESLVLRERIQWYTAMVGFRFSLGAFLETLRERGVENYAVTEFVQGKQTRRWAVAWSFRPMRPAQSVARGTNTLTTKVMLPPFTEQVVLSVPLPKSIGEFAGGISAAVGSLDLMSWEWHQQRLEGIGRAADNVWNRAWRRRKMREQKALAAAELNDKSNSNAKDDTRGETGSDNGTVMGGAPMGKRGSETVNDTFAAAAFGFKVSVRATGDTLLVECRWLEGHDPKLFESFTGYMEEKAKASLKSYS
jgi:23S rRNA (adenine1618-N6)-methyltransferase